MKEEEQEREINTESKRRGLKNVWEAQELCMYHRTEANS